MVNFEDLTCDQFLHLNQGQFRGINYLARVSKRMRRQQFPANDSLQLKVQAAYEAGFRQSDFTQVAGATS